ncbi:hypothetical protein Efla_003368 [Eimeria flavescens]
MEPIVTCRDALVPQRAHGTYCSLSRRACAAEDTRQFAKYSELRHLLSLVCAVEGTRHLLSLDEERLCRGGHMAPWKNLGMLSERASRLARRARRASRVARAALAHPPCFSLSHMSCHVPYNTFIRAAQWSQATSTRKKCLCSYQQANSDHSIMSRAFALTNGITMHPLDPPIPSDCNDLREQQL